MKRPCNPFLTRLSTSAQDTALRSSFPPKKHRPLVALLAGVLAAALVGCTPPTPAPPDYTPVPDPPDPLPTQAPAAPQLSQMDGSLYNQLNGAWENSGDARYFFFLNAGEDGGSVTLMYDIATGESVDTPFTVPDVDPFTLKGLGVYLHPERTAVAYGNPAGPGPVTVQTSPDKGKTWNEVQLPYEGQNAYGLFVGFTTPADGWLLVEEAMEDGLQYTLYVTSNGGAAWTLVENDLTSVFRDTLTGVNFVTPEIGFAASANPHQFRAARTSDGGAHWQPVTLPDVPAQFPNSAVVPMAVSVWENNLRMPYAVTDENGVYYGTLVSEDLGETWQDAQPAPGTTDAPGLFENDVASFGYPAGMQWRKRVGEDGTQYRFVPVNPGPGQVAEMRFSIFEGSYLNLDATPDEVRQQLDWNNGYLWDSAELETLKNTEIEGRPARWKTVHYVKDGTDYIEMTLELLDSGRGAAVEITGLLEDRDHCEKAADALDFHFMEPLLP